MSRNSILESWMDDNSITERALRRGLGNEQRLRETHWSKLVIPLVGIVVVGSILIFTPKKPGKENQPVSQLLPEKYLLPIVFEIEKGDDKYVKPEAIKVGMGRQMWLDLGAETSDRYSSSYPVLIIRGEKGFHVSFYQSSLDAHPEKYQFTRSHKMPLSIPVLSLVLLKDE